MMGISVAIWLVYFSQLGTSDYLDNYQLIENILLLVVVIYYYYEQLVKLNITFIYNQPRFWIVTGYFLFISGIFFLIVYIPTLKQEEKADYYLLNYFFTIIRNIFITVGIYMSTRLQQTTKSKFTNSGML